MSDAGDIITALTTDIETAVSGVTVGTEPITFDDLTDKQLPYCVLIIGEPGAERIEWSQEERTWPVLGVIAQQGGTRETMQTKLEAIRDQVVADPTLGSNVDDAIVGALVVYSHADDARIYGEFSVEAKKVA
jgi:hypothetical protein